MPTYEYRCSVCNRAVTLFFRSFASVESDPACTHCGARALQRRMSRAFIRRGGGGNASAMEPDELYGDLPVMHAGGPEYGDGWEPFDLHGGDGADVGGEDEDPAAFARQAREMAALMGEPLDVDFDRALQHIERGADVDDVLGELDARTERTSEAEDAGDATGSSFATEAASDDP